ncbi:MAG: hypothetical protein A2882_16340 [Phenylobacterium sp. RIFCSPHIGHO2_01_FULL_70_10]|nr:MAG: hypothetical protein A2882_16340 [Phenylobacterium sp. RIFCSPHIGHO2_01_FULL_70_10]
MQRLGWVPVAALRDAERRARDLALDLDLANEQGEAARAKAREAWEECDRLRAILAAELEAEAIPAPDLRRLFELRVEQHRAFDRMATIRTIYIRPRAAQLAFAISDLDLEEARFPTELMASQAKRWARQWAAQIAPDILRGLQCGFRS